MVEKLDPYTFNAVICDCYRAVHPPLRKAKIKGHWVQVPYHYDIEDYTFETESESTKDEYSW